ncbi:drug/metabolite transporter (DMT)-like permease [Planomicrobium sp. HSC-17F08]|uniref:DMT family transporter n=1 Tax=Planococcus glaciei TaxID=459472 RepID=UPI00087F75A7|nr:DMT family transporter [Planococcus glaciei]MCP2036065.1 drug/metabolite transporter (DMT)-like permease [Planomicrobium sp. HSC-17F08]SDH66678.1 Permease of the drug/metabolite transporter (DMT) superfamily [Planococcus glaciei]
MEKPMVHPFIPIIVGVFSVALSAIFVKMTTADSGVTAFYRMLFSILIMSPIFFMKYTHEIKKLSKRDWIFTSVAGIFLAFHFILWFESLNYTSVASSTVLVTLQPLFAFVGTYLFFKEHISLKTLISGMIAVLGSVLIGYGDFRISGTALYGDVLALIACALITGYLLFGQDVRKRLSLITYTFVVYGVSTITLFFYIIFKGESFGPYPASEWMWFLLLAIIPNLLGHTLFNWSLKWVSTNVISIAILFEPVGAAILAYYILGETLSASQIIGGSVVLAGIILFVADYQKIKSIFFKKKG